MRCGAACPRSGSRSPAPSRPRDRAGRGALPGCACSPDASRGPGPRPSRLRSRANERPALQPLQVLDRRERLEVVLRQEALQEAQVRAIAPARVPRIQALVPGALVAPRGAARELVGVEEIDERSPSQAGLERQEAGE